MGLSKPIVSFPKRAIEDVSKIKINSKAFLKKKNSKPIEKELFKNMFEVFLREDYEEIYLFRDEEARAQSESRINDARSLNTSQTHSVMNNSFFVQAKKRFTSMEKFRDFSFSSLNTSLNASFHHRDRSLGDISEYDRRVNTHKFEAR